VEDWATTFGTVQAQLLDVFPALQRLPDFLVPVVRKAKALHAKELKLYLLHWNTLKAAVGKGTANVSPPSIVHIYCTIFSKLINPTPALLRRRRRHRSGKSPSQKQRNPHRPTSLVSPRQPPRGRLRHHLEHAHRLRASAQAEIDRVCGDRLPTMEDEPRMQYVRGCVKESLRWMPTPILGMVRAPTRDDVYMGYRIPKGATVMMNVW
jgi:hypothetical protein